jgi:uncharacterized membrane protein YdjX (TVP38/TMEM64 family)
VILVVLLAIAAAILVARPAHAWLLAQFATAESVIRQHETWGMAVFVALAAVSAMAAFVSSSVLIPVAIYVWSPWTCLALLWAGWFLGGLASYSIGRFLGRPIVARLVGLAALGRQERWLGSRRSLAAILLLQLAVPSDLAGYIFGVIRCPIGRFAVALALAELPYAVGAVYLGVSFVERRIVPLVAVGLVGVLLSVAAVQMYHRTSRRPHDFFTFHLR